MRTSVLRKWTVVGLSVLTAMASLTASADVTTAPRPEKTYTGKVEAVDAASRQVTVRKFLFNKHFTLGDSCGFSFVDKAADNIAGVRPGQKVTLTYQNVHGVLIADKLTQCPMFYKGSVKAIDPKDGTVKVGSRTFKIADSCVVALRNDKPGTLEDVQPGNFVTVLYEKPGSGATAWQIAQTSRTYTGSLTAIDLTDRTIKAKATFGSKEFRLADKCAILLNGQPAEMKDLKPGDKLEFSYDDVDGVNVATRVVPATDSSETMTAQAK